MKKVMFFLCCGICMMSQAQQVTTGQTGSPADSVAVQEQFELEEVTVTARVLQPMDTHKKLSGKELNQVNTGQNLPYLLTSTPSLLATSDDGLGVGYTYFRLRGTDHTRINMMVNDVPLNDSESQTVFWVNMTDMAGSLSSIDVQRGVGTSVNGSSFGASLNMTTLPLPTDTLSRPARVTLTFNGGMYNTFREMLKAEIRLPNRWRLDARISKVNSDGYLYRASSDLLSYHGSLGYSGARTTVALSAFGGTEKTYMAWDGVSATDLKMDRRYNPAGAYTDINGNLQYYPNQYDRYQQHNLQIHLNQRIGSDWVFKGTLHYTRGQGYYEQMKADKKYSSFGLPTHTDEDGNEIKRSNFVRQKHLDNHFYGGVFSFNYFGERADVSIGGAGNHYLGYHYGLVSDHTYATVAAEEYYRSHADKADANVYAKANWRVYQRNNKTLTLYGDLQYRYIYYHLGGINDEDLQGLYATKHYHFFNPKAGITFEAKGHRLYFNFAIANREPTRKNFTEAGEHDIPRSERLFDYELGYAYMSGKWHLGINAFYMKYHNQLVLTGKYSDTGAYLTRNVDKSYRVGLELTGGCQPVDWLKWEMALTVQDSRIIDYTDWVDIYDLDWNFVEQQEMPFGDVNIAFTPAVIFSNTFRFAYKGFSADLQTQAVSKQYLDNTMSKEAMLKAYSVTNLTLHYTLPLPKKAPVITLMAQVNNLFDSKYESNGGNWMCQFIDGSRYYTPWYYAQAGANVHAGLSVQF